MAIDKSLRRAWRFFHEWAGYSTPLGRAACALELAKAERDAASEGIEFTWEADYDGDDSWMSEEERKQEHTCECCAAWWRSEETGLAECLSSLSGIYDASPEYRRVVEAELAQDALHELGNIRID